MKIEMVDLTELYRLREMLKRAGFRYEDYEEPEMGGATIKMPNYAEWLKGRDGVSVIQHRGSFGGPDGKLEVWIKPDMKEPEGWLTAQEAFDLISEKAGAVLGRWRTNGG